MPKTEIRVYRQLSGEVPLLEWLHDPKKVNRKAYAKCLARIRLLESLGNELRRPIADNLGDGIFELRTEFMGVNYRILYFFCGRNMACLSHGFTKEGKIPSEQIARAKTIRNLVNRKPDQHTLVWQR